ncbi:Holliday junction resolvase [Candidatus Saccharibacteria bacterium RIFCSPHIGHO2_01_FULL_45_15]|nr:MAG: Holliday junction resolvase [Candidatus Saccharibacteria bacterium RIFCSPHIGHO2_01_FULL_45_15]OGL28773.1 MAG: Holliday junction resolvase [Candidatus Saccharibacteria bacterium RIFCSPHIGHO2_02_FULL_46_12]OGL31807.1 MAG: Holliday junction resolvase [Candidatus Saccharibacteria bacterium RIFCSPHIGHO2_12_FULL_44_22]
MGLSGKSLLALDVGEKRIGVAAASGSIRIAVSLDTIEVDGSEVDQIARIIADEKTDILVIGYPRNQSGEATAQTQFVEDFATRLNGMVATIEYQDESLTSVMAENQLKADGRPYGKGDIDARAAAIILQDYMESH